MSKNGFFHERPNDYDIYVDVCMVAIVGSQQINWYVDNARCEGFDWIDDVQWEGKIYIAKDCRREGAADVVWTIIREKSPCH